MTRVVAVHGIAQEQLGQQQLSFDWKPAAIDGIKTILPDVDSLSFGMAYYGSLYLSAADQGLTHMSMSRSTAGTVEITEEDAEFFSEFSSDPNIGSQIAATPPHQGFPGMPSALKPLAGWLGFKFGAAAPLLFIGELKQVRRYQREPQITEGARAAVTKAIGDGCEVLTGHSLGSVVALDTLLKLSEGTGSSLSSTRKKPNHSVSTLITIGSPLALKPVRARLVGAGWPPGIEKWIDVSDPRDPVACASQWMPTIWPQIESSSVNNGDNPHSAVRYLSKSITGKTISDALKLASST